VSTTAAVAQVDPAQCHFAELAAQVAVDGHQLLIAAAQIGHLACAESEQVLQASDFILRRRAAGQGDSGRIELASIEVKRA